jgi:NADPH:quinone reductase
MKAAWYDEQGEPAKVLQVGELPDQDPGPGEVKVQIRASGANPTDTYTRSGVRGRGMPFPRIVPHQDGAGVIVAVGDGVLPSGRAAKLPDNCDFNEGACLGVPWLTAHYAVLCDGPVSGRTVLVAGGTGAVGYYAVQIAKHEGARVIATVGSAEKGRMAREVGADAVIDFRAEDVGARIAALTNGNGADRLLEPHFTKNAPLLPKMLAKKGTVIVYGAAGAEGAIPTRWGIRNQPTIKFMYMYELPAPAYVSAVKDFERLQGAGKLKHLPVREFSLDRIAQVHDAVEKGNSGTRMVIVFPAS